MDIQVTEKNRFRLQKVSTLQWVKSFQKSYLSRSYLNSWDSIRYISSQSTWKMLAVYFYKITTTYQHRSSTSTYITTSYETMLKTDWLKSSLFTEKIMMLTLLPRTFNLDCIKISMARSPSNQKETKVNNLTKNIFTSQTSSSTKRNMVPSRQKWRVLESEKLQ